MGVSKTTVLPSPVNVPVDFQVDANALHISSQSVPTVNTPVGKFGAGLGLETKGGAGAYSASALWMRVLRQAPVHMRSEDLCRTDAVTHLAAIPIGSRYTQVPRGSGRK